MKYSITPSSFFIGDKVKLIVNIDELQITKLQPFDITKINESESLTINDISISLVEDVPCLVIDFTPWQTGNLAFPSFTNIGLNVELPTIKVPSILEVEGVPQRLQDARPPILLDGTVFMVYKNIGITVLLLLFFTFFLLWLKKKGRAFLTTFLNNYALFMFSLKLKILRREFNKKSCNNELMTSEFPVTEALKKRLNMLKNVWGKNYENALRKCLSCLYKAKKEPNWATLTYKEIEEFIAYELEKQSKQQSELQESILKNIKNIFYHLSLIRFAEDDSKRKKTDKTSQEEIIDLSSKFIALHKKRKWNVSSGGSEK